jgi:hypothetical protein
VPHTRRTPVRPDSRALDVRENEAPPPDRAGRGRGFFTKAVDTQRLLDHLIAVHAMLATAPLREPSPR